MSEQSQPLPGVVLEMVSDVGECGRCGASFRVSRHQARIQVTVDRQCACVDHVRGDMMREQVIGKKKIRTVDCELRGAREILPRLGNVSRRFCYRTHARSICVRAHLHACNKVNIHRESELLD